MTEPRCIIGFQDTESISGIDFRDLRRLTFFHVLFTQLSNDIERTFNLYPFLSPFSYCNLFPNRFQIAYS